MPYSSGSASRSITISERTVTLNDLVTGKCGETLTFAGSMLPADHEDIISIFRCDSNGNPLPIGAPVPIKSVSTVQGNFSIGWTVPYTYGCTTQFFKANIAYTAIYSALKSAKIALPTRIRALTTPSTVNKGAAFTTSGYLEYENPSGTWNGMSGKSVSLTYDTTSLGTVTTGTGGYFEKTDCAIGTAGSYTLTAKFSGEGLASLALSVSSIRDKWNSLSTPQKALAIAGAVVAVVGAVAGIKQLTKGGGS